jgi:hypothetical protein
MNLTRLHWMVGLLILWAALGLWFWWSQDEPQHVPLTNVSGTRAPAKAVQLGWAVNQPKPTPDSPAMPKRNLFAPLSERQEQLILAATTSRARKERHAEAKVEPPAPPAEVGPVQPDPETLPPPAPPVVAPAPTPLTPQQLAEMKERQERQEREQRIGKLKAQAAQYRLIGLSDGGGVKQAFVEKGSDIYVVKQGDTLDGLFMVSIIELAGVKIRDAEFNVEYTMPIQKKDGN